MTDEFDDWDDDGYDFDDLACTHCGGDAVQECYDPIAGCRGCPANCSGVDTYAPCVACNGTGRRTEQWLF
jgi:hypothetical protein